MNTRYTSSQKIIAFLLTYILGLTISGCKFVETKKEENDTKTIEDTLEKEAKRIEQEYEKGETDYKFYFEEERESLEINLLNNSRYVVHKNENKGKNDMIELLNYAIYEESWAYLPEKELWIELGNNETLNYNFEENIFESGLSNDMYYLNYLLSTNQKLVLYHIHPLPTNCFEVKVHLKEKYGENYMENLRKDLSLIWVPSVDDLHHFKFLSSKFYAKNNIEGILEEEYSLVFNIVSVYGTCQMTFKEKARKDNNYLSDIWVGKLETQESLNNFINDLIGKDKLNIEEKICKHLSDQYFKLEYFSP